MVKTIGNPGSWVAGWFVQTAEHVTESVEALGGEHTADPVIRKITVDDLKMALRKGVEDFEAARTDVIFLCIVYPIIGVALVALLISNYTLHLVFPVAAGFALLGPIAGVVLYEMSRRREKGEEVNWGAALGVMARPNFSAIVVLALFLIMIFALWVLAAGEIYRDTLGPVPPASVSSFMTEVLTTGPGWAMIIVGMAVGFVFALVALAISVVSFPLLLDRNVGVPVAVITSYRVFRENPRVVATWGLIVAVSLALGSIPFFLGLIIVLPIFGHATWHLYRRAVG